MNPTAELHGATWRQQLNEQNAKIALALLNGKPSVDPESVPVATRRWLDTRDVRGTSKTEPISYDKPASAWLVKHEVGHDDDLGKIPRRLESSIEVEAVGSKTPWLKTASDFAYGSVHDDGALARLTHPRFRSRLKLPDPREYLFQRARARRIFGDEWRLALRAARELGLSKADVEMRKRETWKTQKHYARHGTHRAARILERKQALRRVEALVEQRADALYAMIRGYRLGLAYLRSLPSDGEPANMIEPIGPDARAMKRRRRSYWTREMGMSAELFQHFERDLKLGLIPASKDGREQRAAAQHRLTVECAINELVFDLGFERHSEAEVRSCHAWDEPIPAPGRINTRKFDQLYREAHITLNASVIKQLETAPK
jgi:hypothetical protein